jgi:mono/diheme cytochrome c family protein
MRRCDCAEPSLQCGGLSCGVLTAPELEYRSEISFGYPKQVAWNAVDLYTAVGVAMGRAADFQTPATGIFSSASAIRPIRRDNLSSVFERGTPTEGHRVRYLICAALLAGSAAGVGFGVAGQQPQTGGQEGVQSQGYQNMPPAQRGDATRAFLGLGAVPDRVAAGRGAPLFAQNCGFCHGQTARGATGPGLITSDVVLADDHGERLAPFLRKGKPEKGMPGFATMADQQLTDIAEFLHVQVEDVANRGTYKVLNILVGDAAKGQAYVENHCMSCHTAETFAHVGGKFHSPEQLQRDWIWPVRAVNVTAKVKTPTGTISGRVTQISDFRITLVDGSGASRTIDRDSGIEVRINDPLAAHQEMLMTLTNEDMHNVTAYLETLK